MGGGEILRSSGSGAGQSVDFVGLLYIIRLYLSPIYRRRRGIEYNFMLCILALIASTFSTFSRVQNFILTLHLLAEKVELFFFWRKSGTVVAVPL
jgi:hypothetical protein